MMYGLTMSVDGSMELFNITSTMIDFIIEDINFHNEKAIVRKSDKEICIHKDNSDTIYFYDKHDRKERLLRLIDVY